MKWTYAFRGLLSTASLLLPPTAVPESHVQSAAPSTAVTATAHVDFKIIIPQVLSLQLGDGNSLTLDNETVAIMSNGHNVSLNATELTGGGGARAHRNLILSSAARKGIAQDAHCRLGTKAAVCTVSMP